jgi:hypothetical protein
MTTIDLQRTVVHKTDCIHNKAFLTERVNELLAKGADIWMILSSMDEINIIFREPGSENAPKLIRWAMKGQNWGSMLETRASGNYMRLVGFEVETVAVVGKG